MSKGLSDDKLKLVQVKHGGIRQLWELRAQLGNPNKATLNTAAFQLAAQLVKAKKFKLENGSFVEVRK